MLFQVAQVEFHLALEGGFEFTNFEVDGDETPQPAVIEEQVDVIVTVVDGDALLPSHEGKIAAKFNDESLQFSQDGRFEIFFGVAVRKTKKIQHIRIAKGEVRRKFDRDRVVGQGLAGWCLPAFSI